MRGSALLQLAVEVLWAEVPRHAASAARTSKPNLFSQVEGHLSLRGAVIYLVALFFGWRHIFFEMSFIFWVRDSRLRIYFEVGSTHHSRHWKFVEVKYLLIVPAGRDFYVINQEVERKW